MYPITKILVDDPSQLEQLGTKAKYWFWDEEDKQKLLFKVGRPGTGENWAEKVCCEICRLLGIPHAEYDLAVWSETKGILSPTFVPEDARLIHGNELLARIYTDYDEAQMYQAKQHTLMRVILALDDSACGVPIGWETPAHVKDAMGVFVGYLLLDALVGNQDRHHENWGIINSIKHGLCLAPTYDHASSLGRNESDECRIERLASKDQGRSVEHFCGRARSCFYKTTSDKKPMGTIIAFQETAKMRPDAGLYWIERLQGLNLVDFKGVLNQVPDSEISEPARLFALKMLETNRNRLINL